MNKTKIEYLDYTWNAIKMRCTPISNGCLNCWHLSIAKRLAKNPSCYADQQRAYAGGPPMLDYKELEAPIHLKKPSRIGVQFMGDLFHKDISVIWIEKIFSIMIKTKWHQFLILTKRAEEAKKISGWIKNISNLWFGVSVENQRTADERIPILLQIPAAKRFVSCEPLLSEIDLLRYLDPYSKSLNWIICGCESGPKRRKTEIDWIRNLRDQCGYANVPFFLKQIEIDGKLIKIPELDGRKWTEYPNE